MSDKKPDNAKAKASYKSKGLRASGGKLLSLDFSALEFNLQNQRYGAHGLQAIPQTGHHRKALALIRRAARHAH